MARGGHLQPVGAVGEICLSGAGLARGYLNRESLTAERFVSNPFREGSRMYRTGDLGRWLSDGNMEYLGRMDDQVKVRGHRIELGEVEHVLSGHPGVRSCVVLAPEGPGGTRELVGYLVGDGLDPGELSSYLSGRLPGYMVPGQYVLVDEIPLTPNGKVDRRALASLGGVRLSGSAPYRAPEGDLEERLAGIWSVVLDREVGDIGRGSDFFELGGHSLRAVRLTGQVYREH